MASGKPVISTVKMGYSPIQKYNFGIELEDNSASELAQAIIKIKNMDQAKYDTLSQNALEAAGNYDYRKLTEKLVDLIEEII